RGGAAVAARVRRRRPRDGGAGAPRGDPGPARPVLRPAPSARCPPLGRARPGRRQCPSCPRGGALPAVGRHERGRMAAEPRASVRLIDLSHPIEAGMTTYPGLPVPEVRQHLTREASRSHYAPGVEFRIDVVTLCGNTGTYMDSPLHRFAGDADLASLPLERLGDVPAVRIDVR